MLIETLKKHGRIGLGGEGILRTNALTARARAVIQAAIDYGITYFDSARVYSDSEVYYGTVWKEFPETRNRIFQASKSASRNREGALKDLEETLGRMGVDYLDLWQIHDVRTAGDIEAISGPGGALEAFLEARSAGKVRFIGVTGHHDPGVLTRAVKDWPVDAVMMPVNPAEEVIGGFLTSTLPAARSKDVAVIGMKIMGGSHYVHLTQGITPELLIRYALSRDVNTAIVGCSSAEEVKTLSNTGSDFKPLSDAEVSRLVQVFRPHAERLAYYRGVI